MIKDKSNTSSFFTRFILFTTLVFFFLCSVASAGENPAGVSGVSFVEFREAGNAVGRELLPALEKECPRKSDCILEILPPAETAGLGTEDVDILLKSVLEQIKAYRFWAEDGDRKRILERLKVEEHYNEGALEKFANSARGKRLRILCGLTPEARENKIEAECRLLNMGAVIATAHRAFHHPDYIKKKQTEAAALEEKKKIKIESDAWWAGFRLKAAWAGVFIGAAASMGALGIFIARTVRRRMIVSTLPAIKDEFQRLINDGKFVVADDLVKRTLKVVPDDTDLMSFKTRLEIIVQGNPRKAEEAFVKAIWAKKMLSEGRAGDVLPEINRMKALAPHSGELAVICTDLEKIELDEKKERELLPKLEEAKVLAGKGRLHEAMACVEGVLRESPEMKKAAVLRTELKISADEAVRLMNDGKSALMRGRFGEAGEFFSKSFDKDNSIEEAATLMAGLRRCNLRRGAVLLPEGGAKPVKVFTTDCITIGREDADVEIADQRISRKHCVVKITDVGFLVEDCGSKNGVTVNGEKAASRVLNDGDSLGIAGAGAFSCRLHNLGGKSAAVVLENENVSAVFLVSRAPLRICSSEFRNASQGDELVLVKGEGRSAIIGISSSGWEILQSGRRFRISQINFSVEEIA